MVDDDPQAAEVCRDTLLEAGFTPIVTADPEEALLLMEEQRPHLVLLDLVLPDADGIDLMKSILRMADVPVLFVSAYDKDQIIAQALEEGATDYIVKPSRRRSWWRGSGRPAQVGKSAPGRDVETLRARRSDH